MERENLYSENRLRLKPAIACPLNWPVTLRNTGGMNDTDTNMYIFSYH
jgi:hypothetical protein